jgi:DNA-binding NarL/FixJ family response regulator
MKILLVDDNILFREGLASLLDTQPGLNVAGSAHSIQNAMAQTDRLQPDLILMDFYLTDGHGLDFTHWIRDHHPQIKVVFFAVSTDDAQMLEAINQGAVGHLRKNIPVNDLLRYIQTLESGETTFSISNINK